MYLQRSPVLETLARFSANLKRFATANGKPNLYHETITWAYVFLINERIKRNGSCQSWEAFAAANADLLDWKNSVLKSFYREETLRSDLARATFLFPDVASQTHSVIECAHRMLGSELSKSLKEEIET